MGQSYGGYTALCALTASKRFKAGVVANGLYDLLRAETDGMSELIEGDNSSTNASPWEKPQRYIENSPLYALDKLQTPLLVIQGDGDDISNDQGKPLFNALQRLGKPAEFLVGTKDVARSYFLEHRNAAGTDSAPAGVFGQIFEIETLKRKTL